ncbi:MAG: TetR/AcrR family transcriptional regulator [Tannerella sp.]|jgi:AcrR family transcriptional regulator|nr:TetR/AcrR family transcriptional regulator [Tannerella sp.]
MEERRKRRTKRDIEESLNKALIQLVKESGFQNLTVMDIVRKANIEPVVFYNRYNDLNEFIDEFVKKYDYWFSDIVKECGDIRDDRKLYVAIMENLFRSLKENRLMQQLLKWELSSDNDITRRTVGLREFHTIPPVNKYKEMFAGSPVAIDAVSALIIGGIYYLVLHAGMSTFADIDINTEDGSKKISDAIAYLGDVFFSDASSVNSGMLEMAEQMKKDGMKITSIAKYTGLPIDVIQNLYR